MRRHLLVLALVALTAAQTAQPGVFTKILDLPDTVKTTIDDISYSFVKQRNQLPQITVPLPAAAYKDYGNIKLVVIAIPYSPDEDFKLGDILQNFIQQKWDKGIEQLLSIRSVYYPYETFRVKLIFIMFITTQTLIDYAIESSKDLLSTNNAQNAGAALYTNTIIEILKARYQNWRSSDKSKLEQTINSFTLQSTVSGDTIKFTDNIDGRSVVVSVTVVADKYIETITIGNQTINIAKCKLFSSVDSIKEEFTAKLATQILNTLPYLTSDDVRHVFGGKNDTNIDFNSIISDYYNNVIFSRINYYTNIIRPSDRVRSLFTIYKEVTCEDLNCDCGQMKGQVVNSILQKKTNAENLLKEYYGAILSGVDGEIGRCLGVVDQIKYSLTPQCSGNICKEIQQEFKKLGDSVAESIGNITGKCVGKYLGDIAKSGINSVVSPIPGANLVYILANGIMGALQNQVIITGQIVSEPVSPNLVGGLKAFKIYNVSNRVACYSAEIREISGQNFVSRPSATEAVLAGLKGFASAAAKLYVKDAEKAVDLIPIIRIVDIPQNGYFMFTATPGIYVLSIKDLDAKSIVNKFKEDVSNTIKTNLQKSYKGGSNCPLYVSINSAVLDILRNSDIGNRTALYKKAYGENYNYKDKEEDRTPLTLNMYFVVVPPYMAGVGSNSGLKYNLTADLFGFLRSFLFPTLGDVRRQILTGTNLCGSGTSGSSMSAYIIGNAITSTCENIVDSALHVVDETVSSVVNKLLDSFDMGTGQQSSGGSCSMQDILVFAVNGAVDDLKQTMKNEITNIIRQKVLTPLSDTIRDKICGQLGSRADQLVNEQLSSALGKLLDLYNGLNPSKKMSLRFGVLYSSETSKIKDAVCGLIDNPQVLTHLGLYVTKVFDAAEEGLYIPSYFLSAYPIQFKESPTARWCYSAVVSPYYTYTPPPPPTSDKDKKQLLVDALDVIEADRTLQDKFYSFLQGKQINVKFFFVSYQISAAKGGNDQPVACDPSFTRLLFGDPYKPLSDCFKEGNLVWTINSLTDMTDNAGLFVSLSMFRGQRVVDLPALVGVNRYFNALKVYPAIAVREAGNPNPYYFVVPYSTPARELFVLGTVGSTVVRDGGSKVLDNKPFLYYDVSR